MNIPLDIVDDQLLLALERQLDTAQYGTEASTVFVSRLLVYLFVDQLYLLQTRYL